MSETLYEIDCRVTDVDNRHTDLKLPSVVDGTPIKEIESQVFEQVALSDIHAKTLHLRASAPNGAGIFAYYEKRGETWVRLHADNVFPWWFPLLFLGMIVATFAALYLIGAR